MRPLPEKLLSAYNRFMRQKSIPSELQSHYRKWLRYYVDFCSKYHHAYAERNSQVRFVAKLEQKGQSQVLRRQAQDAVDLYYEMLQLRSFYSEEVEPKKTTLTEESTSDFLQGSTAGTDWRWVYVKLEEQIRVRHYSDRTLESYRGWTRQWSKHF